MKIKMIQNRITKDKNLFISVNDKVFDIEPGRPEIILEDGSIIIFPGIEAYATLISNEKFIKDKYVDENFLLKRTTYREDINHEMYYYETDPVDYIDIIEIEDEEILSKLTKSNSLILFRIFLYKE